MQKFNDNECRSHKQVENDDGTWTYFWKGDDGDEIATVVDEQDFVLSEAPTGECACSRCI